MADADLAALGGQDEDELLADLGAWHLGENLGVSPREFAQLVRIGREWLEQHHGQLRDALCLESRVVALRSALDRDEALEIATVADVLTAVYGHVGASIVAVLVVRRGLARLCS